MDPAAILIVQHDWLRNARVFCSAGAGYRIVGMAGETCGATALADEHHPDLAVVDMMLEMDVDGVRSAFESARRYPMKTLITTGFPDSIIQAEGVTVLARVVR